MSFDDDDDDLPDDLKEFIARGDELKGHSGVGLTPEQVFKVVTIMPKRKLKVTAHLVDKEGDRIEIADIAEELLEYIQKNMTINENNSVNSQVFPLISQLMIGYTPRAIGIPQSSFLLGVPTIRNCLIDLGMAAFLMMQYIKQHELKIVTNEEDISDQEMRFYTESGHTAENKLAELIQQMQGDKSDE